MLIEPDVIGKIAFSTRKNQLANLAVSHGSGLVAMLFAIGCHSLLKLSPIQSRAQEFRLIESAREGPLLGFRLFSKWQSLCNHLLS